MNIFYEWAQHLVAVSVVGFLFLFLGGGFLSDTLNFSKLTSSIKRVITEMRDNGGGIGIAWVYLLFCNAFLLVFTVFHNMFIELGYEQIPIIASVIGLVTWWAIGFIVSKKQQD